MIILGLAQHDGRTAMHAQMKQREKGGTLVDRQ